MIFLTVGTYPLPFDRLIRAVDELVALGKVQDSVLAQIGHSGYEPRFMRSVRMMDKVDFDETMGASSAIISHAGLGNISLALEYLKPILVVPRLPAMGEVVNDHQLETARRFEALGHIIVSYSEDDIERKLELLRAFRPKPRSATPRPVAEGIGRYLSALAGRLQP